jgi:hypothetical protein
MKINIQAAAIRAAAICSAKKDIRYYLVGVHIKVAHAGYASVIGTNGHIMFAGRATIENLEGQQSSAWTMTIPLETCKKINKKADTVILESLPDGNYLIDGIKFTPIDGRFPDHTRVITRTDQVTGDNSVSDFDYAYLVQGNDALNAYHGGKNTVYPLVQRGNDAGLMHAGENTAVVVIMPRRSKGFTTYQGFNESFPDPLTTVQLAA